MTNVADAAEALLGTPFHWGGRVPGVGLDCAGVVIAATGDSIEDWLGYGDKTDVTAILERFIPQLREIDFSDARPGDILVFWLRRADQPVHMGILAEGDTLIHAHAAVKQCVREPLNRWRQRVFGVYRIGKVA